MTRCASPTIDFAKGISPDIRTITKEGICMNELLNRISTPHLIQITIDFWNSLFLFIISFLVLNSCKKERRQRLITKPVPLTMELLLLCIAVFFYNLFDMLSLLTNGYPGPVSRILKPLGEYGYFFTGIFLLVFLLDVIKKNLVSGAKKKTAHHLLTALQCIQGINLLLLITNPLTKKLFLIDSSNCYSRGIPVYYIWSGINIFSLAVAAVICTVYFRRMTRFQKNITCVTVGITLIACVCNIFFYSISLHCICVSLITLYQFIIYSENRTNIMMQNRIQLEKLRTDLVLSQISPHFIQNSITAIIYYADKDTEKTRSALINFSKYLRMNIDYINTTELVSIEEEIEHAKVYLSLAELRFGEDLKVVFDLRAGTFELPVLTVQPIVENAVKHGIKASENGCGTVTIRTAKTPDHYAVIIEDDGAGFDTALLDSMDASHTGISSVKCRLMLFCRGSLSIESTPGKGTVSTITIPRSEVQNENTDHG